MTERVNPNLNKADGSLKVWQISEYCKKNRLDQAEEARLKKLFGEFATAGEIRNNISHAYRGR